MLDALRPYKGIKRGTSCFRGLIFHEATDHLFYCASIQFNLFTYNVTSEATFALVK